MEKATSSTSSSSKGMTTFPYKLYETLNDKRSESSINWLPHGLAFRIHDKEEFSTHVMPRYFKTTKMRSFQRQLNLWGFQRIVFGADIGAWWHVSFVMGHPQYLESIERTAIASNARNSLHHYNHNPDFYHLVTSQAQQQLLQNQDTSTTNTNNNTSTQQAFWPFAHRASAPPEFMMHQSLHGMNQQAAVLPSLNEGKAPIIRSVSDQSPLELTSVSVSEHALFPSMAEKSTYNTADSFSNVRQASAPPEFTRHQLLPGMNQQPAVSLPLPASAEHSVYNTADSCLNTLSTSSLHGTNTVAAYGLAEEELKQSPDRNESSSPLDEFSQFIESSIHLVPGALG